MTPYEALLARLLPARRFGIVLGLERMHAIFERLGHPERRLGTVIHVGGTNGKGSTVTMIAQLLRRNGDRIRRVATYTSPHLSCLRERIRIDGDHADEMISEQAIVAAADRVRAADGGGDEHDLTFFEQLTAIACVAIAERDVDYTILEVGLGGRLDATNAILADVAVVTGVAMDHEAILGDTLAKIALEKAGIFKPGQRVVIGASGEPAAVPVLVEAAKRVGATYTVVDQAALDRLPSGLRLGTYQRRNAAAAIATATALGAPAMTRFDLALPSGRFEVVATDAFDVILDGAHNPHAARALAEELGARSIRPTLIVATSSDKDVRGIADALRPVVDHVIATRYQQGRSLSPEDLAAVFRLAPAPDQRSRVVVVPDLAAAIALATTPHFHQGFTPTVTQPRPALLITGSLFLVGEARIQLLGAPSDPYVVTDPAPTP